MLKNSNSQKYSTYNDLMQDFLATKGEDYVVTQADRDRIMGMAQLATVNTKIQDLLSQQQYTIKNDEFARKGGGYGFYVEQLNPVRNIETLQKEQRDLLQQLVNSNNIIAGEGNSWRIFM